MDKGLITSIVNAELLGKENNQLRLEIKRLKEIITQFKHIATDLVEDFEKSEIEAQVVQKQLFDKAEKS